MRAAEAARGEIVDDDSPDEETSEHDGIRRKFSAAKAADSEFRRGGFQSRARWGTWDVESERKQFLEVVGRNEILILRVLPDETGDVGTERDNTQMMDAGELERHAGEFCSHALAFEWLRHFGVGINDTAGEAAISD